MAHHGKSSVNKSNGRESHILPHTLQPALLQPALVACWSVTPNTAMESIVESTASQMYPRSPSSAGRMQMRAGVLGVLAEAGDMQPEHAKADHDNDDDDSKEGGMSLDDAAWCDMLVGVVVSNRK